MNDFIIKMFREIEYRDIAYCHFKSNNNLEPALCGVDDLDLLVSQKDIDKFMEVIAGFGFRQTSDRDSAPTPFVYHFFGIDPDTGLIVHLHVYFRIITGGSILKNHWIRVEQMFLEQAGPKGEAGVYIPSAEADLILFVIRKFIEQPSLIEHYLFVRDAKNILRELDWLNSRADREKMRELVAKWLPSLPVELYEECYEALVGGSSLIQRIRLGIRMRKCFVQTVYHPIIASLRRAKMFAEATIKGKLSLKRKDRVLYPGGMIIAFVGSEASGKSTLSKAAADWLGERFDVTQIHMGKPKKNWRTQPVWAAIRIYSSVKGIFKSGKSNAGEAEASSEMVRLNMPNPVVCWLDSVDRRCWITKHATQMLHGGIIITDRYPARKVGGLDGARIQPTSRLSTMLSGWEQKNYSNLPHPDFVLKMVAPLETTLSRNEQRDNPEPESFVRQRYKLAKEIEFPQSTMIEMDTTQSIQSSIRKTKNIIWGWGKQT